MQSKRFCQLIRLALTTCCIPSGTASHVNRIIWCQGAPQLGDQMVMLGEEGEAMRWFLLPSEAQQILTRQMTSPSIVTLPFYPRHSFKRSIASTEMSEQLLMTFQPPVAVDVKGNDSRSSESASDCSSSAQKCCDTMVQLSTVDTRISPERRLETETGDRLADLLESSIGEHGNSSWQPRCEKPCYQDNRMQLAHYPPIEQQTRRGKPDDLKGNKPKFHSPPKKIMTRTIQVWHS